MNPFLISLFAALGAVGMEYLYRVLPGPWWSYLWIWIPVSTLISFSIYSLVTQPGVPLFGALVMWSFAVIGARIVVTLFFLHDPVTRGNWAALGLLVMARLAQALWK